MPLVLHESSTCDVCLNEYTWQTPDDAPHAIPCGHIFCRSCLLSIQPPNCPLCRKAFYSDRVKKLHVEPPESDAARDLLHRLALAFDADTDEQTLISEDLNTWLEGRPEDDVLSPPSYTPSLTRFCSFSTSPSARPGRRLRFTTR
ncbi:hypothetical protein K438DRAFT_1564854 [Mycena galopus ATCC 62051]|nr:hypothetical protein K438DRAFT_1564854 [Mycena galopus ATCC 62051]